MSDTPETDREVYTITKADIGHVAINPAKCRELERDRNRMKAAWDVSFLQAMQNGGEVNMLRGWLNSNTTYIDGRTTFTLSAKRIWYHATDDVDSFPFTKMIDRARGVKR